MSRDKNRAERRRADLVRLAKKRDGRLLLNHVGGIAMDNPDLQEAIKRKLFRIWRGYRDGTTTFGKGLDINHGHTPRTFAILTDKGKDHG